MKLEIDDKATILTAFTAAARRYADRIAIASPEGKWTYSDLMREGQLRGKALLAAGLKHGDVVGLAMVDGTEFIALLLGACLTGITAVIFTPDVRADIIAPRLPLLGVDLFIASGGEGRSFLGMMLEAHRLIDRPFPRAMHIEDGAYAALLTAGMTESAAAESFQTIDPDQAAIVVFTSGVTALPKNCWISHRNLVRKAQPFAARFELSDSSRLWIGVGMFQIGFVSPFLTAMLSGATLYLTSGLEGAERISFMSEARLTHAYPIYLGNWLPIVNAPAFMPSDFGSLSHVCLIGPISALRRAQRALPQAVVMNTYGGAEQGGGFCMPRADDPIDVRLGSSGRPFDGHEIRIVDPVTDKPMPRGSIGEIQVRGPGIPLPRPDNRYGSIFTPDAWLRTSDLGMIRPDGALVFRGRFAEMLTIGGERVSAVDIETAMQLHPDIAVAQVIGRDDAVLGQVAVAFVELRPNASVTAEELISFCQRHLPGNHVPRHLRFISTWPTSSSKIFKPSLADMVVGPRLTP